MARRKDPSPRMPGALLLPLVLLALALTGATLAYLITHTDPVPNRFTPAHVSCNVTEDFDGPTKKNVTVTNTGDIDAYLRVKLVTYRVHDDGHHIGRPAPPPAFPPPLPAAARVRAASSRTNWPVAMRCSKMGRCSAMGCSTNTRR